MLREVFAPIPFDYEAIFASWPDAPIFTGHLKKDGSVEDWLTKMKAGLKSRKVAKQIWHNVAQNYLQGRAKRRFEDVKGVMKNMHGGKYRWDWKRFKIAMVHMGWELKSKDTQGFKIGMVSSGFWWIVEMVSGSEPVENRPPSPEVPSRRLPFLTRAVRKMPSAPTLRLITSSPKKEEPKKKADVKPSETEPKKSLLSYPWPRSDKRKSDPPTTNFASTNEATPPLPAKTEVKQVPIWLLDVTHTLDALTDLRSKYPKTMSVFAAVLITVGSIPSIPAVGAGAAGAVLASETAKVIGGVAIGIGGWLREGGASETK